MHWLDAYDTDLAADATRLTNRLRDALTGLSPALERVLGPKLHNAGARDLLARYPTPQALATAGHGRIARTLRKRSPRLAKALTEAVTEALDAQTVVVPGSVAMGRVIAEVATELDRTQQRRERLGAEIGELFQAHPAGGRPWRWQTIMAGWAAGAWLVWFVGSRLLSAGDANVVFAALARPLAFASVPLLVTSIAPMALGIRSVHLEEGGKGVDLLNREYNQRLLTDPAGSSLGQLREGIKMSRR